jgi:hypothetical protein
MFATLKAQHNLALCRNTEGSTKHNVALCQCTDRPPRFSLHHPTASATLIQTSSSSALCRNTEGLTKPCARIWTYDAISDAGPCGATCLIDLKQPYNLPPTCKLNDCLQCDEDHAGPEFKRFAARTRRRSGLISAIQRPCGTVAQLKHVPCAVGAVT